MNQSSETKNIENTSPSRQESALVRGGVGRTLFSTAFPLLAGTFAMSAYNLTDTWFVSRLGTVPLAAMGFTFPVVMLLACVAIGMGTAITALVSHAMGRHDHDDASAITTHGLMLILGVIAVLSLIGYLLMEPIFTKLGADKQTLPLVAQYMRIWFAGTMFMVMPITCKGVLISAGDSKSASLVMFVGPLLNIILDPIMIFGHFGFPAMGIRGAALATIIARAVATVWILHLFLSRHKLLAFKQRYGPQGFLSSSKRITRFAIPSVLSMILMPISATVITKIVSGFGREAVAACGAAQRMEMFAFVIPMALGMSLTPFISQNFGAGRMDRVNTGFRFAAVFALLYGGIIAIAFFAFAPLLASVFTSDPLVAKTLILYIRIISFGYGMMEVHRYCGFILTGLHKPSSTTLLNIIRIVVFLIPLSLLGARFWNLKGVFTGRLITDLITGCIGLIWITIALKHPSYQPAQTEPETTPIEEIPPVI